MWQSEYWQQDSNGTWDTWSGFNPKLFGKIYTPVHKPKPFKGIKIYLSAAELMSVLLLLLNRILRVCILATLVFVILRKVP